MKSDEEEFPPPVEPSQQSSEQSHNLPTQNSASVDVEEQLRHLIKALEGGEQPPRAVVETIVKLSAYRGWPPADVVRELEAALPGSGERLLRWTEKQTSHRQALEKLQVEGNEKRMDRGQFSGLGIGIVAMASGTYIITKMDSFYGLIGGVAVVAIGVVTPTAMHIARGIRHWLGDKSNKSS